MEKMKQKARQSVYWPQITQDIERMVRDCATCAAFRPRNMREPMIPHEVPPAAWIKIGADIMEYEGIDSLIVADYYSKYPEVMQLKGKSARSVINALKPMFARHGIPEIMVADNNPFNSHEFKKFAAEWGFVVVSSSPRYPQSNGQSEIYVKIIKNILRKCHDDGSDPNAALLEYRNSPITGLQFSSAQILMGRQLKGFMPRHPSKAKSQKQPNARGDLEERQRKQKMFYDRRARARPPHNVGDSVRVQGTKKTWQRAIVTGKSSAPRSYFVITDEGSRLRRNSRFINKSSETLPIIDHRSLDEETGGDCNNEVVESDTGVGYQDPPDPEEVRRQVPECLQGTNNEGSYITRSGRMVNRPRHLK